MKAVWEKLAANAADAKSFVEEVSASGIQFLQSNIEKIPLFSATHADVNAKIHRDETHYFLVPDRNAENDFALYTIRSLPPEVGPVNSLEKARIFHLHDPAGVTILESLIISNYKAETAADAPESASDFADRLDELAQKIDSASTAATGGFIIVGSLVAIANPLLGAGIAAKALFPSIGNFAATTGIKYIGDKFRQSAISSNEKKAEKAAQKEARRLKPEIFINPVIRDLQSLVFSEAPTPDQAVLSFDQWLAEFESLEGLRLTEQAILAVYEEQLSLPPKKASINHLERQWLIELQQLTAATSE